MAGTKQVPDWAPQNRNRWPAGCTPHRDGWVRWYKGATRFVCGKKTPLDEVEDRWISKKQEIDAEAKKDRKADPSMQTYREVLSEFLERQKARVGAGKNRLEDRTYQNYANALNDFGAFAVEGDPLADLLIHEISPAHFSAYARKFRHYKASAFDSIVSRVSTLFRWAVEMGYLDAFRPGPDFIRPGRQDIRDQRIDRQRRFELAEVAKIWAVANDVVRCWIALGLCAAFNNSDIAHLTIDAVDLKEGVIDFRRRKTGKVRRVIPLPAEVKDMLTSYRRPEPGDGAGELFFVTSEGNAYSRTNGGNPSCSISTQFAKLIKSAKIKQIKGRNFAGLRTTFYNLPIWIGYEGERAIIMGRAKGTIDLDHYLEEIGQDRLKHVTSLIWQLFSNARRDEEASRKAEPAATDAQAAGGSPQIASA